MEAHELTLRQYQAKKLKDFRASIYGENLKKLNVQQRKTFVEQKKEAWKRLWYDEVIMYGISQPLNPKVIRSFDKEYGRQHLLHCFRGNRKGLNGWINTDAL